MTVKEEDRTRKSAKTRAFVRDSGAQSRAVVRSAERTEGCEFQTERAGEREQLHGSMNQKAAVRARREARRSGGVKAD